MPWRDPVAAPALSACRGCRAGRPSGPSRSTIANVGGLAVGPLIAGALGQYVPGGVTLTFVVLLAGLIAAGIVPLLTGLIVLVVSAWTAPPSLALFLVGTTVAGVGQGAVIRGSLSIVIATASAADRAGAVATYFTGGYVGVSLPVLGAGVALLYLSPRATPLLFALIVGIGILAAAPRLVRTRED